MTAIHYTCLECGELVPLGTCTCGPRRRLKPASISAELLEALKAMLAQLKFAPRGEPEKVTIKDIRTLREASEQARAVIAKAETGGKE